MDHFDVCCEILRSIALMSFRFRPKTDDPVEQGLQLSKAFEQLSEDERHQILSLIQPSLAMKLLALSGFMAEAAINNKDISLIRSAIIMHVLENFQNDYRENIRYLVLVAFAIKKLGIDFHSITSTVLPLASDRSKNSLINFLGRVDDLNNLSSFGIREEIVEGTFRFIPI